MPLIIHVEGVDDLIAFVSLLRPELFGSTVEDTIDSLKAGRERLTAAVDQQAHPQPTTPTGDT